MLTHSPMHSPKAPVPERMADFIISHCAANDGVTRDDLLVQFTDEQIAKHFPAAQRIARQKAAQQ